MVCTQVRTTVYGRGGRGLRGPVDVGLCACDKTHIMNQPTSLGWEWSPYIMHSASDTIGPGGWGQRPQSEPA